MGRMRGSIVSASCQQEESFSSDQPIPCKALGAYVCLHTYVYIPVHNVPLVPLVPLGTYAHVLVRVRVRMLAYVCVRTPVYVPLGTYTPVHNVPLVPLVPLGTYAHVLVRVRVRMLAYVCVRTGTCTCVPLEHSYKYSLLVFPWNTRALVRCSIVSASLACAYQVVLVRSHLVI